MIDLSALKPALKEKPVAVLGLGRTGLAVFDACRAAGIDTVLWDDNAAAVDVARARGAMVEDLSGADFSRFSLLCMAPGIPFTHPLPHPAVLAAQKAGVEIVCDIELLFRAQPQARIIGITGTNGKSTTTALVGHILKSAGVEVAVGGNIGEAALSLSQLTPAGVYVLELSSYQLDLCPNFSPTIAALVNISPDHLDRHGGMDGYIAAKKKIFRTAQARIVGVDDDWSAALFAKLGNAVPVSCRDRLAQGVSVTLEGVLQDNGHAVIDLSSCATLHGVHNWQNAGIAYAACRAVGIAGDVIASAMKNFPGLAHRQFVVAVKDGVRYINDSKATNDDAAAVALRAYNPVYWIAGGKPKGGGWPACDACLGHVRHAYLIGDAAAEMGMWLAEKGVVVTQAATLDRAVAAAHEDALRDKLEGATVLLAPACASFDQFRDFEERGNVFMAYVQKVTAS